jgi:DivIVA domain-containing protein
VSSQGQRFRRRALRRGYKVDEVDTFLDRVEATLAGEQVGPPVAAQEVHDVVFRVRFGGYDEWQVDLHLDRVERQLAEFEDRGGRPATADSMRGGMSSSGMSSSGMGGTGMGSRSLGEAMGGGMRGDNMRDPMGGRGGMGDTMGGRGSLGDTMAGRGGMGDTMGGRGSMGDTMGGRGEPMGGRGEPMGGRGEPMGGRGMGDTMAGGLGAAAAGRMAPPTERLPAPVRDDRMTQQQMPQRPQMPAPDPYGRYEEPPPYGQQPQLPPTPQRPSQSPGYDQGGYDQGGYDQAGYDQAGYDQGGYDQAGAYDGFEAGRHGKTDMTAEIRMPQREADPRGYGPMGGGQPTGGLPGGGLPGGGLPGGGQQMPGGGQHMPGAPMSGPPAGAGYGPPQQPQLPPPMGEPGGELHRVDQLRRTFQPRRFGSGYDPMQVDGLFEGILQAMTGRGPMPVPENELDMLQFGLVPGGYFEAEVDAALREVKDILLRHR